MVTEEMVGRNVPCGDDPAEHRAAVREYAEAGFDEFYVGRLGPQQEGFFDFYRPEVLAAFG
ncbi:hypothetical protein [Streptodolium elevatio]